MMLTRQDTLTYVHIQATLYPSTDMDRGYGTWKSVAPYGMEDIWTVDVSEDIAESEGEYDFPYQEINAFAWLDPWELAKLREEWSLEPNDEPLGGYLADLGDGIPRMYADERHSMDGMDWNTGGISPVMFVDVFIVGPGAITR